MYTHVLNRGGNPVKNPLGEALVRRKSVLGEIDV
jgi:hypothetical protein